MSRRMPPTPVAAPWYGSTARRVVVRLDLERDRQPVADRDHAGVLARPGDDALAGGRQRPQQRLRALVRAVLAPHDAEHRELEVVRVAAAEAVADRVELVVGHAEAAMERLHRALGHGHRAGRLRPRRPPAPAARAALSTSERMIPSPSSEPRIASAARSGCGISPATLPAAFMTPAIARSEPFGLAAIVRARARSPVRVDVAEQDLAVALERVERRVVGVVAALAVGDRHPQRRRASASAWVNGVSSRSGGDRDLAPGEPQRRVAEQRAGHEAGLGQDLEAVADPEDEPAVGRRSRRPPA